MLLRRLIYSTCFCARFNLFINFNELGEIVPAETSFYYTYKIIKNQQDESDAEYNYLEAKYHESELKNLLCGLSFCYNLYTI